MLTDRVKFNDEMDFYFEEEQDIDEFLEVLTYCMQYVEPQDILYYGSTCNSDPIGYVDFLKFVYKRKTFLIKNH